MADDTDPLIEGDDPWRTRRLAAIADFTDGEARIEEAVRAAIDMWLAHLRRLVLGDAELLTAAGGMPSLEGFGDADLTWLRALREFIRPAILELFGERFLRLARIAPIGAQPYRDAYVNQVFSRLRLFPAEEFENIRFEIAEAISEGEGINAIRDRVAAQLNFDSTRGANGEQAESRGVQGRIDDVERLLDADAESDGEDPEDTARLTSAERKALKAERRELYERQRLLDQKWAYKARRIARTEAVGAMNAGDYSGALAAEQIEGRPLWKQWLSTEDERTRPSHVLADGQIKPLREPFQVGGWPLEHPGDPVGPGHEVINCRCTALYVDSDELGDMDVDPADLPPPEGDPMVSPEQILANAERNADRIEAMAELAAGLPPLTAGGTMAEGLPNGWRGVLAPMDVRSGDGRIIATPPALRVREAPRALLWQPELDDYHGGAVVVGRIDRVWEANGMLMGEGPFDLGDEMGQKAARQMGEGFSNGVSVDLDDFTAEELWMYADGEMIPPDVLDVADYDELWEEGARPVYTMTDWRLMTATLVSQPAFNEARLEPLYDYTPSPDADLPPGVKPADAAATDETVAADEPAVAASALPQGRVLVASLSGDTGLPVAPDGTAWDAAAATGRIFERFTDPDTGEVDAAAVAAAYLWVVDDADAQTPAAYMLGFADLIDDALTIVPDGVTQVGNTVADGPGEGLTDEEVTALRAAVCDLWATVAATIEEWPDCPTAEGEGPVGDTTAAPADDAVVASGRPVSYLTAAAAALYAAADFADPKLDGPTPLVVADDGTVRGHLALFGTCHTSFPDVCVTPPKSSTGYALFHLGEIATDQGPLGVGKITLGTGHAGPKLGARPAAEHYDHTGSAVAIVRAGEDKFGIWVSGRLLPDVPPSRVAALKRSPLSGDWRRVNGVLELVAALAVNTPGFPVPRSMAASAGGAQVSLVAAGVVPKKNPRARRATAEVLDPAEFARRIIAEQRAYARRGRRAEELAQRLGLDHASRAAALAERVGV